MKIIYYKILIMITLSLIQSGLKAQVTIGANVEPNIGSLLDIKEYNATTPATNNTTTTKGMILPRVNLTNLSNLFPMFSGNTDYENNTNNKKDVEDVVHAGLLVYNVNTDLCKEIYPGIKVWDGEEWLPLGEGVFPSETDVLVDSRNPNRIERYKTGKFGDAGWWMLENLRAELWPDGTSGLLKEYPKYRLHPKEQGPLYWYPKLDMTILDTHPEYGFMYSGFAALNTTFDEIIAGKQTTGIQGICPGGWHLPTLAEWIELRDEFYRDPCPYAHSDVKANTAYNTLLMGEGDNARGRSIEQGGFGAVLLGSIENGNYISTSVDPNPPFTLTPGQVEYFPRTYKLGEEATFWLSDTTTDELNPPNGNVKENIWGFAGGLSVSGNNSYRATNTVYTMMKPVRCKKDVITKSASTGSKNEGGISTLPIIIETVEKTKE